MLGMYQHCMRVCTESGHLKKKKTAVATGIETASVLCLSYPTIMGGGSGGGGEWGEWREGKGGFFGGPGWVG